MADTRDELMKMAIPSDYVRDYYNSIERKFSDFEMAAMLWNSHFKYYERFELLKRLYEITDDNSLKEQILKRQKYEKARFEWYADNSDKKCVYVVMKQDEDGEDDVCGYFFQLKRAIAYAKNGDGQDFSIQKQLIIDEEELPKQKIGEFNPNLLSEGEEYKKYEEYRGNALAEAEYTSSGVLKYFYCEELPEEIEILHNKWDVKHYENYPVMFEYPFEAGDIVRHITDGSIGVVTVSKESHKAFYERIRKGLFVDYFDSSATTVEFIRENGEITHGHPAVVNLEKLKEDALPINMKNYILCVRDLLIGRGSLEYFLLMYHNRLPKSEEEF